MARGRESEYWPVSDALLTWNGPRPEGILRLGEASPDRARSLSLCCPNNTPPSTLPRTIAVREVIALGRHVYAQPSPDGLVAAAGMRLAMTRSSTVPA